MNAGGFAVRDQRWRGLPWEFDQDERWRFVYQIVQDESLSVAFSMVLYAHSGTLRCALEG
jgi:hypothetical protein